MLDLTMKRDSDDVEVVIQHELVQPGRARLYVHVNGETVLRIQQIHHLRVVDVRDAAEEAYAKGYREGYSDGLGGLP